MSAIAYTSELGFVAPMPESANTILRVDIIVVFDESESLHSQGKSHGPLEYNLPFTMVCRCVDDRLAAHDRPKFGPVCCKHVI